MKNKYKLAVMNDVQKIDFKHLELDEPSENQVLVKIERCAICTLEQRIYSGVIKRYPFAGGHEISGVVEKVGEGVTHTKVGDKVALRLLTSCGVCHYCRTGNENQCRNAFKTHVHKGYIGPGGFSEYMLLDSKAVFPASDDTDINSLALTEPLSCCVHSVNKANIKMGNDVVIIGAGIMGLFHVMLSKLRGARVIVCEIDDERLKLAKSLGADIIINSLNEDPIDKVKELTDSIGADVVFCTAALTSLAKDSIEMLAKTGVTILYSSFHPSNPIDFDVNAVHSKETLTTGAVNSNINEFHTATKLISNSIVDPKPLISGIYDLEDIDGAFKRALEKDSYRILVKTSK